MKKDRTRDYTTDVFRVWAAAGYPTYDEALMRACDDDVTDDVTRVLYHLDILAAAQTTKTLEESGRGYIADAVRAVYCSGRHLTNKDISGRVRRHAHEAHADERTVYRWLREARRICAEYRLLYAGN